MPERPLCFSNMPENTNFLENIKILLTVKFLWYLFCGFREKVENVSANQRQRRPFRFSKRHEKQKISREHYKKSLENIKILLPVKFHWILFFCFREKVENLSANHRQGRPSWFSNRHEKHKLGRGRWDLTSCQVSLNSGARFQRRSLKSLSQSEARAVIFLFQSPRQTQTW